MAKIEKVLVLFAASLSLLLSGCAARKLEIGLSLQLSGRMAETGVAIRNGATLAAEECNAQGRIAGRQLALIVRDDRGEPRAARTNAAYFGDRGVALVIGSVTSTPTLAALDVLCARGIPLISPYASSSALLSGPGCIFLLGSPSDAEARSLARCAAADIPGGRAALVYDVANRVFAERWMLRFAEEFAKAGGSITTRLAFTSGGVASPLIAAEALSGCDTDLVVIAADALDAALIAQRLALLGLKRRLYCANWAMSPEFLMNGGSTIEGATFVNDVDEEAATPESERFRRAYRARFEQNPPFAAYLGYEAVLVAASALTRSGGRGGPTLAQAIVAGSPYHGLQGDIAFSSGGVARREQWVFRVRAGRFVVEAHAP